MRVFVTGASGFVGKRLVRELLRRGDRVTALTRRRENLSRDDSEGRLTVVEGDPASPGDWQQALRGCDAVVALAGEQILGHRWNDEFKRRLYDSRIEAMKRLGEAFVACPKEERPSTLVAASAVGYYGSRGDEILDEDSPAGQSFVSKLCIDWETQARAAAAANGVRAVHLRIGIVLGKGGGVLEKTLPAFRAFVGGPLGDGRQWFPWIHIDDIVGTIVWALDTPAVEGPLNLAAPQPARMREFANTLGAVMHRPALVPVPALALKILFGEGADVALASQRTVPKRLTALGYTFRYPELRAALEAIVGE